jgi:hypothetical protein
MIRSDLWSLLASFGYNHLHVYVLPPGFDTQEFHRLLSLEERGNENFMTPRGMRQWYESAPDSTSHKSDLPFELSVQASWKGSSPEGLSQQVKWRDEGFGCAVIRMDRKKVHQQDDVVVQLFTGPFVVAETILPAVGRVPQGLDDWDIEQIDSRVWKVPYNTGGSRIVSSSDVFRRVFASYARKDIEVVKIYESFANAIGQIECRWDLKILQAGDHWEESLLKEIEAADSFQLFWSKYAKKSKNVRKEWSYALELKRDPFIRPVYWNDPIPKPPKKLSHIHFSRITLKN